MTSLPSAAIQMQSFREFDRPGSQQVLTFRSRAHPGTTPPAIILSRAGSGPLAACLIPVMILVLVAVLQARPISPYLAVAFPVCIMVSGLWTRYRLKSSPAEIGVTGEHAAVRTTWDVMAARKQIDWRPVLDLRVSNSTIFLSLGDTLHELHRESWPDDDGLVRALISARRLARHVELSPV